MRLSTSSGVGFLSVMGDTLQQIRWKLWRAREKSKEADDLCKDWLKSDFCTFRLEQDRQGRLVMRIGDITPAPVEYVLLIGEIAHHLRSALDHLVYPLARPATRRAEDFVKFPLCSTRKRFGSQKARALPGVPRGVVSLVESVQPYHRRKWPETRLLGQLQAIDNWNKHRALPIAASSIETSTFTIEVRGKTSITRQETFKGRVKPNKVITRLHPGESEAGSQIYCHPVLGVVPVFDEAMGKQVGGLGVRSVLNHTGFFIESEVLPRFERFF